VSLWLVLRLVLLWVMVAPRLVLFRFVMAVLRLSPLLVLVPVPVPLHLHSSLMMKWYRRVQR
jgi:hypothetical protein